MPIDHNSDSVRVTRTWPLIACSARIRAISTGSCGASDAAQLRTSSTFHAVRGLSKGGESNTGASQHRPPLLTAPAMASATAAGLPVEVLLPSTLQRPTFLSQRLSGSVAGHELPTSAVGDSRVTAGWPENVPPPRPSMPLASIGTALGADAAGNVAVEISDGTDAVGQEPPGAASFCGHWLSVPSRDSSAMPPKVGDANTLFESDVSLCLPSVKSSQARSGRRNEFGHGASSVLDGVCSSQYNGLNEAAPSAATEHSLKPARVHRSAPPRSQSFPKAARAKFSMPVPDRPSAAA
mmetsp:Transcript_54540/g.95738  ORF Transcript_54540/g.95738 Transcript_54540/m.95738 type:complete len:295 (-) Transcript_54540:1377-2261(-)